MTVSNTTNENYYSGNGTQTVFQYTFKVFAETDLEVYVGGVLQTSGYTIDNVGNDAGGNVTFTTAPATGTGNVALVRKIPLTQGVDLVQYGRFDAEVIEEALDKAVIQSQQQASLEDRAVTISVADPSRDTADLNLPLVADRADRVMAFDASGNIVAGPLSQSVETVEQHAANVDTVADDIANVNITAGSIANVNNVGGSIANVNTTAGSIANVNTVAGNIANVNTVGGVSDDVTTVAGSISDVQTVASNITHVQTVANDLGEVVSEIETVALDLQEAQSEINTVAASIGNVDAVGTNIANVNTVAGVSTNVTTVAGVSTDVTTVAGISANVTTVAGIDTDVTTVAGNNANVTTVAGNNTNVTTVATNIADVNSAADNMAAITAAPTHASTASTKAGEAAASATAADNSADDAGKMASTAHNTQYTLADGTTTGYSALHYATEAANSAATIDTTTFVSQDSETGAAEIPAGTTAQRPAGVNGKFRYNSTLGQFEGYAAGAWGSIGGGASGGGSDAVFYENDTTVTEDYTITSGKNAMSAGPITVADTKVVTVPDGSEWTVV